MCAPSHLRASHLRSSYPISSHLHHICASSYLRFLSQIFTSSLSSSGSHILRPHLVFTPSGLHRVVTLSLSYHLQDFIMQLLSQLYNLIYLRLQNFIPPLSGQPSSSWTWPAVIQELPFVWLIRPLEGYYDILSDGSSTSIPFMRNEIPNIYSSICPLSITIRC